MDMRVTYLETGSRDPFYNLAFEEYVLAHRIEGDYLILWQNDNTVVIGRNQNAEEEIDRAFVEAHGVRVVRRTTGGGAVYYAAYAVSAVVCAVSARGVWRTLVRHTRAAKNGAGA